jgi:hypothetical protein
MDNLKQKTMYKLFLFLSFFFFIGSINAQTAPIKKKAYVDEQKILNVEAATPRAGYISAPYRKADGNWYEKTDAGVEQLIIDTVAMLATKYDLQNVSVDTLNEIATKYDLSNISVDTLNEIATKYDLQNISIDTVLEIATKYDLDIFDKSIITDGTNITGDGTLGNELTLDTTNLIATKTDLSNLAGGSVDTINEIATKYDLQKRDKFSLYENYTDLLNPQSRDYTMAGLEYVDATTRRIYQNNKGNQWNSWELKKESTGIWRIAQPKFYEGVAPVDNTDDTLTYVGTTQVISNSSSLGTSYTRFDGNGEYVEWTFSGKTELFLVAATLTNGGIVNVTLDGGTDGLNLVPLVGGLRQLDTYNADNTNTNTRIPLSNTLNPNFTYTVRVTTTGTKNPSSSDAYLNFEGFGTNLQNIDEALTVLYGLKPVTIGYLGSEYEYAYLIKPSGATGFQWTGSGHLNETMSSKILNSNGDSIDVDAINTTYVSKSFKITEIGVTNHSELGTTPVANVFVEKEFTGGKLNVFHRHRWLIETEINSALIAMFPVREEFNKGVVIGEYNAPYDLTSNDDSKNGSYFSRMAYCYDPLTNLYGALIVKNVFSSNNYDDSNDLTYIEDRAGGALNKIYFQRAKTGVSISVDDIWESSQTYIVGFNGEISNISN